MLGSVQPTAYDLRFRLFSIPVRVGPSFWLVSAIFGFDYLRIDAGLFGVWMLVVFVSILVHELGHGLTAKWLGYPPTIVLYQFGGMAFYRPDYEYTPWRATMITAAGPLAGLGLCLVAYTWWMWGMEQFGIILNWYVSMGTQMLIMINLWYSLFNLLPVLPLDGGRLCESVCAMLGVNNPRQIAAWSSVIVGSIVAVWFWENGMTFNAIIFGMLAFQSTPYLHSRD
ncbi:MAG: site-2 protease family protein [Planctomycetaceae bacterium]